MNCNTFSTLEGDLIKHGINAQIRIEVIVIIGKSRSNDGGYGVMIIMQRYVKEMSNWTVSSDQEDQMCAVTGA